MQYQSKLTSNQETAVFTASQSRQRDVPVLGAVVNDRFRLIEELGRGGMAVVYLAEHTKTGDHVALKMMNRRLSGSSTRRFTREFSTIASIDHQHCLRVFEYGESELGPFFAMELFKAAPLTALVNQPLKTRLRALYDLASALDYVHSRRIIHRDIKPGNMLVRLNTESGHYEAKLADFGLAKFANVSSSLSEDTNFMGTIAYCAPEQIMREEIDQRADIYAFGVSVYELLAGEHPFLSGRGSVQLMISSHLRQEPDDLRTKSSKIPPNVARVVMRMLEKEAQHRPASLESLQAAIAESLGLVAPPTAEIDGSTTTQIQSSFVGRVAERKRVDSIVNRSLSAQPTNVQSWVDTPVPSMVYVTGDAGIGKTSLMRQAARTSVVNGARLYEGRCFEGNRSPFQPVVEIVRQLLLEQSEFRLSASEDELSDGLATTTFARVADSTSQVDKVLLDFAPELHRIGPELRNLLPGRAFEQVEIARESDYIYRAVASFFIEVGRVQPSCILIDDLQWADNASLTLLKHICAKLADDRTKAATQGGVPSRLFLLATSRVGKNHAEVERYIQSVKSPETIALATLDATDTRQIIAAAIGELPEHVDDSVVDYVATKCLGNPFFITSSLREWLSSGQLKKLNGQWQIDSVDDSSVSSSVHEGLKSRITALGEDSLKVVSVAALIGKLIEVPILESVTNFDDEFAFLDSLDDLFARNILQESKRPKCVEFSHDLIREVTLERTSTNRRRGWHRRIAATLQIQLDTGASVPLSKLADHYLHADDDSNARTCLIQAGENSWEAFAYVDAIEQLKKASRIAPEDIDRSEARRLYFLLGKAYAAMSQISKAEQALNKALKCAEDDIDQAEILGTLAESAARRRSNEEAFEYVQSGLALLRRPIRNSPIAIAWDIVTCNFLAMLCPTFVLNLLVPPRPSRRNKCTVDLLILAGAIQSSLSLLRYSQAAGLVFLASRREGDWNSKARGYAKYATNLALMGLSTYAHIFRRRANQCATASEDPSMLAYARGLDGIVSYSVGDISVAEPQLRDSLRQYDRLGECFYRQMICHYLRHTYEVNGQVTNELVQAEEEHRMATVTDDWEGLAWAEYGMADTFARSGDLNSAYHWMEKSADRYSDHRGVITKPVMELTYAFVLLQDSRYEQAAERLKQSCRSQERDFVLLELNASSYPRLTEALLGPQWHNRETGKRAKIPLLLRFKSRVVSFFFANTKRETLRIRGRHAASQGKQRKSTRLFSQAIELSRQQGADYTLARSLLDRSLVSPTSAEADRKEGFEILQRCGATIPNAERSILDRFDAKLKPS